MHKRARRLSAEGSLNITSMMDMMTIILVFLLKSYSTTDVSITPSDDMILPVSSETRPPRMAVNVVISRQQVIVDGNVIANLQRGIDPDTGDETWLVGSQIGRKIPALFTELTKKASDGVASEQRFGEVADFDGQILLQCDRRLPFSVIRDVMYTAGQAHFGEFRFVVIRGA